VSIMTVHRDLDALAGEGWLTKIRGGATANPSALLDAGVRERSTALQADKAAIAARAAALLGTGQTVFLDDSTTALALLPHLAAVAPVQVATNFLPVVQGLAGCRGVDVVVLGGRYYPLQEACFGMATVEAVKELRADLVFLSTTAVNAGACYHRSETTVMVKRALMAHAARTVLLVDHAKFGRPAPHLLCPVQDFDVVVTDAHIDPEDLADLRALDVVVEVAAPLS
jgi:DeoR/GlpR family transcriptional regulator of sugar metabolism